MEYVLYAVAGIATCYVVTIVCNALCRTFVELSLRSCVRLEIFLAGSKIARVFWSFLSALRSRSGEVSEIFRNFKSATCRFLHRRLYDSNGKRRSVRIGNFFGVDDSDNVESASEDFLPRTLQRSVDALFSLKFYSKIGCVLCLAFFVATYRFGSPSPPLSLSVAEPEIDSSSRTCGSAKNFTDWMNEEATSVPSLAPACDPDGRPRPFSRDRCENGTLLCAGGAWINFDAGSFASASNRLTDESNGACLCARHYGIDDDAFFLPPSSKGGKVRVRWTLALDYEITRNNTASEKKTFVRRPSASARIEALDLLAARPSDFEHHVVAWIEFYEEKKKTSLLLRDEEVGCALYCRRELRTMPNVRGAEL